MSTYDNRFDYEWDERRILTCHQCHESWHAHNPPVTERYMGKQWFCCPECKERWLAEDHKEWMREMRHQQDIRNSVF